MTFTPNDLTFQVTITMSESQYALMAQALTDPMAVERVLLSHLQLVQATQEARERDQLQAFVDSAPKEQRTAVLNQITEIKVDELKEIRRGPDFS